MTPATPDPLDDVDDEALHWAGDEARGQAAPRLRGGTPASAVAEEQAAETPAARRTPRERALLAVTVVFGVLYLALTLGWIASAQLLGYPGIDLFGEIMWQFGEFLSLVAPALWFGAVLALSPETRARRVLVRTVGLALGLLVLLPWPYLLGVLA